MKPWTTMHILATNVYGRIEDAEAIAIRGKDAGGFANGVATTFAKTFVARMRMAGASFQTKP